MDEFDQSYAPNLDDQDLPSGGACFLSQDRVCGSDCMSYLDKVPDGPAYLGENWAKCHILVNVDRGGRHLAILAQVSASAFNLKKNQAADESRANQPPPPGVR